MIYLRNLILLLLLELLTLFILPVVVLFTEERYGPLDNGTRKGTGTRLALWLFWFDTPDNSLDGDTNHRTKYADKTPYVRHLFWLYRNRLYGFKTTVLSCYVVPATVTHSGPVTVNCNNGVTGLFRARTPDGYWQWKLVKKLIGNWGVMWNFGWQIDELVFANTPGRAQFHFSPRFETIK